MKDAVATLEAAGAREREAIVAKHKEVKHRLRHCECVLEQTRSQLAHATSQLRERESDVDIIARSAKELRHNVATLERVVSEKVRVLFRWREFIHPNRSHAGGFQDEAITQMKSRVRELEAVLRCVSIEVCTTRVNHDIPQLRDGREERPR